MKRVRKAKVDGTESVASSDDSQNGESLPGGHSVLEISGPTIPSPGPSGTIYTCILHEHRKSAEVLDFAQLREMSLCFFVFSGRSLEGLYKSWLAGTRGVPADTKGRPHHCCEHLVGCFCQEH